MYPSMQNVKFQENLQSCSAKMFDQNIDRIVPCEDYIYDNTYFDETLATNLDLVCDKESLVGWLGTIQILAAIFGAILGGKLGDKFGRKNACFIAILILAPAVSFGGFVTSYHGECVIYVELLFIIYFRKIIEFFFSICDPPFYYFYLSTNNHGESTSVFDRTIHFKIQIVLYDSK